MSLFKTREIRRIEHNYIYYDERKEKLKKIEESAKRELGMLPEKEFSPEEIRGKFVEQTTHLKRYKESGHHLSPFAFILLIIGLIIIWRFLLQ